MNHLFIDFLNSEHWDGLRLERPDWLERLLEKWRVTPEAPAGEAELAELRRLRVWLRERVRRLREPHPILEEDVPRLNTYLGGETGVWQFAMTRGDYRIERLPARRSWEWVHSEIVLSFLRLLTEGEPKRVKICENRCCNWVYYDSSKNQSRKWCDHGICGNLMNVRRHRERKKRSEEE